MEVVPLVAASNGWHSENSDFCNQCDALKDCYWVFEANNNTSCYYAGQLSDCDLCVESFSIQKSQKLYWCVDCRKCFDSKFLHNSQNCSFSWFLKNCSSCEYCFGSINLQSKKYYFYNKKYSKEEYFKKLESIDLSSYSSLENIKQQTSEFFQSFPHPECIGKNNEQSSGNYLNNTQNCKNCYDVQDAQNCKNVFYGFGLSNVHDMTVYWDWGVEFCYDNHEIGQNVRNVCFSEQIWEWCSNIFYCKMCIQQCHDLFWCIGLRNSSYCIFNVQYTQEEYFVLRQKIIEHMRSKTSALGVRTPVFTKKGLGVVEWWEFFPMEYSPFWYNETVAQDYFPVNPPLPSGHLPFEGEISQNSPPAREGLGVGALFNWSNYEPPNPQVSKIIPADKLPENIVDIPDDILNWAIKCKNTQKPFRIIKPELAFYRKYNLPIPRLHPDERHALNITKRNPRELVERQCDKCNISINTTYSRNSKYRVYCKKCYKNEIV